VNQLAARIVALSTDEKKAKVKRLPPTR
jgi:hypothetical protein